MCQDVISSLFKATCTQKRQSGMFVSETHVYELNNRITHCNCSFQQYINYVVQNPSRKLHSILPSMEDFSGNKCHQGRGKIYLTEDKIELQKRKKKKILTTAVAVNSYDHTQNEVRRYYFW